MARKITKAQLAMAEKLTYKLAEVEDELDNLWFAVDSKHPSEAQLSILMDMLHTITRRIHAIVRQNGGTPHVS